MCRYAVASFAMSSPDPGQSPDLPASIAAAYDPERFRRDGHELIDAIADALARWQRRDGVRDDLRGGSHAG